MNHQCMLHAPVQGMRKVYITALIVCVCVCTCVRACMCAVVCKYVVYIYTRAGTDTIDKFSFFNLCTSDLQ